MTSKNHAILGRPLPETKTENLRQECARLCGWERETFPGSQPVSFTRRNLQQLNRQEYVVCEKSDGERFLLLSLKGEQYLVDRKYLFYKVDFQHHFSKDAASLLDGELITDHVGEEKRLRYLVYDAVVIEGESVKEGSLLERLKAAQKVVRHRKLDSKIVMYLKDFFSVKFSVSIYKNLAPRLPHECDGLIFTPVKLPYIPGTCKSLLKWKPAELNTVDFVLDLIFDVKTSSGDFHGRLLSAVQGVQQWQGVWLARSGPQWEWLRKNSYLANGKVVECRWDPQASTFEPATASVFSTEGRWVEGGWVLLRTREDRLTPNDVSVVEKVKASIKDGVSVEELGDTVKDAPEVSLDMNTRKRPRRQ